ncbi:MAG: CBS domain-containing protein [Bauldia sp.]
MRAADIMRRQVLTISPTAGVSELAKLLVDNGVSAVPVVDDAGKLVGIVSENDMVRRVELGTAPRRHWLRTFLDPQSAAKEFVKANSQRVADVMTRKVVTIGPDTPIAEIATLLESHQIKRVPVVDGGRVVGIVSRANLIQALGAFGKKLGPGADPGKLRARVEERIKAEPWHSWMVNVTVDGDHVDLWGMVDSEAVKNATRVAAETTPGVKSVGDHLLVAPAFRE